LGSGIGATKKIISTYNSDRPKIIAITGGVTTEDKELCLASGMDDFISKSFIIEDLIKLIKNYFSNYYQEVI
jgi:CheY-like chemotaxis protein